MTAAQLNLSFCIATLLLEGDVFVEQFSPESIRDPARMSLAAKVTVLEDPEITARGAKFRHMVRVTVRLADGTELTETVEAPHGSEHNFPSLDVISEKFAKLTAHLPPIQSARIHDMVLNLEQLPRAADLAAALMAG